MIKKLLILIHLFFSKQNQNTPKAIATNLFGFNAKWLCFVFFVFQMGYGQSGCNVVTNGTFSGNSTGWTLEGDDDGWYYAPWAPNEIYIDTDGVVDEPLSQSISALFGNTLTVSFNIKGQNANRTACNTTGILKVRIGGVVYMTINNPANNTTITTSNIIPSNGAVLTSTAGFPISAVGTLTQGTITFTIPWASGTTANLDFLATSSNTPSGTGLCAATSGGDDWILDNISVIASDPTSYGITGSNGCAGTNTAMGLNGSQTGVNYQLRRNGTTSVGSIVPGTGAAISLGTQSAAGTYTVMAMVAGQNCKEMNGTILINSAPTTSNAGPDQTGFATCGLTSVTLAGNNPAIGTGTWSIISGTGGSITTPSNRNSTFTGTAGSTYTLRWTISNSPCTASTDDVVITFNRNPTTSNAGPDQTGASTCGLTSVTLAGNTPSVGTGAWTIVSGTGGTVTTPSSPTSTFTGTAGSTYTLRWTISNSPCTASTDDVVITFNRNPTTSDAGPDQTSNATCGLTSVTLAGNNPSTGTGSWSIVSGTGGTVANPSSRTSTFTGTSGSTYTLRWTITNGVCTSSDDVVITFNRNPTTSNAGADQTGSATCGLTTVTLGGNTPTFGSGSWSIISGSGGTIATPSSGTSNFSGVAGNSYTLRWTISTPCNTSTDDVVITFNRNPTTSNAGPDQTLCGAGTNGFTLAANAVASGETGVWTWTTATGIPNVTDPGSPTTTITLSPGTSSTFTWTITRNGCTTSDSVLITNNPVSTISGTLVVCVGQTTTLTGGGTPHATTPWTSATTSVATVSGGVVTGVSAGTSVITYKNSYGCDTMVTITVRPMPTATISGTTTVCQGTSSPNVTFTNPRSLPITVTYNINSGTSSTVNVAANGTATVSAPTGSSGTFTYNLVSAVYQSSPSCSATLSGSAIITVLATPSAPTASAFQTFCAASSPTVANLTATGTGIKWYAASSGGSELPTTTTLVNGNKYYASQTTSCESARFEVTAILNAAAVITPNKDDETCPSSNNGTISPSLSGGLTNVRYIKLTQKYADHQQVQEIQAFEIFTGNNVALASNGATASASSTYSNVATFGPQRAIDGDYTGYSFWHSASTNVDEYIMVDLASAKNIDYLRIYNRSDCCQSRGQNMLLELFDASNNLLYAKTVNLWEGVNGAHYIDVNVMDVTWSDAATTLNRTGLDSGSYTLNYTDAVGCSASAPITITSTNNVPGIAAISSPSALCSGGSLNPSAPTVTANGSAVTASGWQLETAVASGSFSSVTVPYTTSFADNGKRIRYFATNGCGTATSNTVTITVNDTPAPPTIGTITHLNCTTSTGSVVLENLPGGSWTIASTPSTVLTSGSGTTTTISGLSAGIYTFTVTNSNGCPSGFSSTVTIFDNFNTWNGSSWSRGVPPNASMNVIIDAVTPDSPFAADLTACALTINTGVVATVPSGRTLTITNEVTVNGSLTFENNASLVQINNASVNSGSIIYKRSSQPMKRYDFTYWSSPVAGQTLYSLSPNTRWDKYLSYTGDVWKEELSSGVMQPGIGYIIRVPEPNVTYLNGESWSGASYAQTLSFTGRPNNGVITSSQYMEKDKYYLIGNPYPSAIHADAFLYDNVNNRGILGGTVYFWTHNTAIKLVGPKYAYVSDDYASYNLTGGVASAPSDPNHDVSGADNGLKPTGYIGAGQSFFTSAESGSGNVEFTNEMRYGGTHNSQFFKPGKTSRSASMEKHRLWLNLTNAGGAFKQTLIGYIEGATNTYDKIFDGLTYDGNSYIDFYSINEASDLTIQGRALPFTDADVVPLGYRSTIAGEFTIAIDQADGSLATQRVYLEDKQLGTISELTAKNYTFTTKAGTFKNRFVLRYKNNTLETGDFETTEDAVSVLAQNKTVTVNSTAENIEKVFLYDLSGKLLYSRDNVNNLQLIMQNLSFAQQVLLVKVVLDNGYQTTKKVIFK